MLEETDSRSVFVVKRNGRLQPFARRKLHYSLTSLAWGLKLSSADLEELSDAIAHGLTIQISSVDLRLHSATTIANYATRHPDYSILAGRVYVSNLHKSIDKSFTLWVTNYGEGKEPLLDPTLVHLVQRLGPELDDAIVHSRDFMFSYGSIHSLAHSYLLRVHGRVIERPQFVYMRVALSIHKENLKLVFQTYEALSQHLFTFATPTLANAGTLHPNFASCFLYIPDSSAPERLLRSAHDLDLFWLADGGIGLSLGGVPSKRARPRLQPGITPLMRVYDEHAEYTSMCRQTRPAAATVHLPIWHGDTRQFVTCRTSRAAPDERVYNLYPSLWIPDIFMQRSESDQTWRLFDPSDTPNLLNSFGDDFTAHYLEYENTVPSVAELSARELWITISRAQEESGTPFLMFQDAINRKNNEGHLGVVKTSNLCTEIVQYASRDQTAVCTLASIAVPRFVLPDGSYDFPSLHKMTKLAVLGTDALIDVASYPTKNAQASATKTRAIGIGIQGLADVFKAMRLPFESKDARAVNIDIFETIYHASYDASCDLAAQHGPYPSFSGSPASAGQFQHDMWPGATPTGRYDFAALHRRVDEHGLRNSMLTTQMPTASTARLLGNADGVEPCTSNIVIHRILSGDYPEICPWLARDLHGRGLWNEELRLSLLRNHGSIQNIASVPADVKDVYKTAWEIDPLSIIDMAADRGPFIDQTQSMSLNIVRPSPEYLLELQLHAWRRGLKTGLYYMRTQAPTYASPWGVGPDLSVTDSPSDKLDGEATIATQAQAVVIPCEGCSG